MNRKQVIVILGLSAYIAGGVAAVCFNLSAFIKVAHYYPRFLIPVILVYSVVLLAGVIIIYLLRNNGENQT